MARRHIRLSVEANGLDHSKAHAKLRPTSVQKEQPAEAKEEKPVDQIQVEPVKVSDVEELKVEATQEPEKVSEKPEVVAAVKKTPSRRGRGRKAAQEKPES